jgi:hypothetical protein
MSNFSAQNLSNLFTISANSDLLNADVLPKLSITSPVSLLIISTFKQAHLTKSFTHSVL